MVVCNPSYISKTNYYEYLLAQFRIFVFVTDGVFNKEAVLHYCPRLILRLTLKSVKGQPVSEAA